MLIGVEVFPTLDAAFCNGEKEIFKKIIMMMLTSLGMVSFIQKSLLINFYVL